MNLSTISGVNKTGVPHKSGGMPVFVEFVRKLSSCKMSGNGVKSFLKWDEYGVKYHKVG